MLVKTTAIEAKIYRNSATVTRSGSVSLNVGKNTFYLSGMTKSANPDSFTVKMPDKLRTYNIQIVYFDSLKDVSSESEKIAAEISKLNYQVELCHTISDLRKTNGDFTSRNNISIEDQESYMEGLSEKLISLNDKAYELTKQKEKLALKLQEASIEEEKPLILIELDCDEAGDYPVLLTYQETLCKWFPKYEVHFSDENKPLDVYMKACILQSSKENWKNIKTILYTGNPTASHDIPKLFTTYLSLYEENSNRGRSSTPPSAMSEFLGSAMVGGSLDYALQSMGQMVTAQAEVVEEETMSAFVLPDKKDILSDTKGNIATLQMFTVDASYEILCIPSVSDKAFMTAVVGSADWPFAAAEASIYLKGTLIGNVFVNPDSDSEEFKLSLGQDERLNVIREELLSKTQNVLLKNQRRKNCEYRIKINNRSSLSLSNIIVEEPIPLSSDKSINVDLKETSNGTFNEENGILKWKLNIDPEVVHTLDISYDIVWPKDKRLKEVRR